MKGNHNGNLFLTCFSNVLITLKKTKQTKFQGKKKKIEYFFRSYSFKRFSNIKKD